jgi:hypothetical protein
LRLIIWQKFSVVSEVLGVPIIIIDLMMAIVRTSETTENFYQTNM